MPEDDPQAKVPVSRAVLAELPLFPLPDTVFFPGTSLPLHVFEPRYREMVEWTKAHHGHIGVVLLRPGYERDYEGRPPIHDVLTAGRLLRSERLPDGRWNILLKGLLRVRIARELTGRGERFRLAEVRPLPDVETPVPSSTLQTLRGLCLRLSRLVPDLAPPLSSMVRRCTSPKALAQVIAARILPDAQVRQALLEEVDDAKRVERLVEVLAEICLRLQAQGDEGDPTVH